jgi:uncharacterized membrane protein YdcZ (DUF606 family)
MTTPRIAFWLDASLGSIAFGLTVLTVVYRNWIERLTGLDPDAGSGALEWAIAGGLLSIAIVFGALARREWRTAHDLGT